MNTKHFGVSKDCKPCGNSEGNPCLTMKHIRRGVETHEMRHMEIENLDTRQKETQQGLNKGTIQ